MTLEEMLTLFQYDEWATKRTIESVSPLSEEQYKRDLKSSYGGIHGTLCSSPGLPSTPYHACLPLLARD